jgi:hypothetical protein
MRHLAQALLTVLYGDYANTTDALTRRADKGYQPCHCDVAYNDGHVDASGRRSKSRLPMNNYCRQHSVHGLLQHANISAVRRHLPGLCPKWTRMHLCSANTECYRAAVTRSPSYLLVLGGLHYQSLGASVVNALFSPTGQVLKSVPANVSLVCGLLHAPGANKRRAFLRTHGERPTRAFNSMILQNACRRPGDFHFDAFSVTYKTTSIDGQHYAQQQNVLLAQVLLNQLRAAALQRAHR